jgi:uncharacterized membrane protein
LTWMSALRAGTAVGSAATDGDLFGFSTSNMKGLRQRPAPTAVAAMQPLRSRRPGSTVLTPPLQAG